MAAEQVVRSTVELLGQAVTVEERTQGRWFQERAYLLRPDVPWGGRVEARIPVGDTETAAGEGPSVCANVRMDHSTSLEIVELVAAMMTDAVRWVREKTAAPTEEAPTND